MTSSSVACRDYLLDVSRLIWRRWSGRLPTGIDRVCLEYVKHFGPRSQAIFQYKGGVFVLSAADTDRLFGLICEPGTDFRRRLVFFLLLALARGGRSAPRPRMLYLNVGHTGLDRTGLVGWLAREQVRAVYLIHDLIPITHPQFCRPGETAKHQLRMRNAVTSAAGLICNSEVTRGDLREFCRKSGLAMPPSVVAWISGSRFSGAVAKHVQDRPYFVTVGTIEGRKNHVLLLKVWQSLASTLGDRTPQLVVIGQRGWEAEEAISMLDEAKRLSGHVLELPHCGDKELAVWLGGARALLMPSFVEGFGLPVIEALQLGVPVVASDLPVYHEIVGDIPTYLNPLRPLEWEGTIRQFAGDSQERRRQLMVVEHYEGPEWPTHFETVQNWLDHL